MRSKHWIKRSKADIGRDIRVRYRAIGVLNGKELYIALAIAPLFALFGLIQSNIEFVMMGVGGFVMAGALLLYARRVDAGTYRLSRKIKLDYDSAEFGLRKIFKEQDINVVRKLDKALLTHTYEFPMHDMDMSINPYDLIHGIVHGRDAQSKIMAPEKLGVLVTLNKVSDSNQSFVDNLAAAIDDMALQPAAA